MFEGLKRSNGYQAEVAEAAEARRARAGTASSRRLSEVFLYVQNVFVYIQ